MTFVSSQVRFTTPSGANVNTFHFSTNTVPTYTQLSDQVATALTNFYNGGGSSSIGANMAGWVSRSVEIRNYDPNTQPPRVPTIYSFTLPAAKWGATDWSVPADVAMCLSYHASPPITRRKRGRIYITGPSAAWLAPGTVSSLPAWNMTGTGPAFAANLAATALAAAAVGWSVYSRAAGAYFPVVGGYVDSEPDTQRRRGATTSTRNTWGV